MTDNSDINNSNIDESNSDRFSHFDSVIINANVATFSKKYGFHLAKQKDDNAELYGQLFDAAIGIKDGRIAWLGAQQDIAPHLHYYSKAKITDAKGGWVTPGLIDCHTHLVYAGNRSNEFEARLHGASYQDIAKQGGGIVATVQATRDASMDSLLAQSEKRLQALLAEGVTSIEIKSGYGLNLETERKMLQAARILADKYPVHIRTTYLAAHALPAEYKERSDDYIDAVCDWMQVLHSEGLIDAVDGFCENIAFSTAQIKRVFDTARDLNLPVKLHADQLSNMGGSSLVAEYKGLSSDHLEHLSEADIQQMAAHGTVAVLLPGAFYTLRDTTLPPIDTLRQYGVPMALSTDCNPGTSPLTSLLLTMNMGCTLFYLTPEEVLAGTTVHAAKALGLDNKGKIEVGCDADLVLWDIARPADLCAQIGLNPAERVMYQGQWR